MEAILRPIYQERASQPRTLGVLIIDKKDDLLSTTESFDTILLIIVKDAEQPVSIKHYTFEEKKAALHVVTEEQLKNWILLGTNKRVFDWVYNGKILFDRNEYVAHLKRELEDFPSHGRKVKMGLEFAKLIRRYLDGKAFFEAGHYLDAYNHVIHSLHHLARLAVIEKGFHPEVTVWKQVKQIDPEINKLYEELVTSEESLEKRLELLFLASEFLIHAKEEAGTEHLLDVLNERDYWPYNEIIHHDELQCYSINLTLLIEYLIEKELILVENVETKNPGIYHRYYKVANKEGNDEKLYQ